jgi:hypothetical protein
MLCRFGVGAAIAVEVILVGSRWKTSLKRAEKLSLVQTAARSPDLLSSAEIGPYGGGAKSTKALGINVPRGSSPFSINGHIRNSLKCPSHLRSTNSVDCFFDNVFICGVNLTKDTLINWWCPQCGETSHQRISFFLIEPCHCPFCHATLDSPASSAPLPNSDSL